MKKNKKTCLKMQTTLDMFLKSKVKVEEKKQKFFPYLFRENNMWKVWVIENSVSHMWGIVGGKMQSFTREYDFTNKGKINEMSPFETACSKAERDWASQVDKGYKPKETDDEGMKMYHSLLKEKEKHGGSNFSATSKGKKTVRSKVEDGKLDIIEVNIFPMLCTEWEKEKEAKMLKHFSFEEGIYVEPKYDGARCVARIQDGKVLLTSRKNKQFGWLKCLRDEIYDFLKPHEGIILDGELYSHSLQNEDGSEVDPMDKFNVISSICKMNRKEPHILEDQIQFYIFDVIDFIGDVTQEQRNKALNKMFSTYKGNKIVLSKKKLIHSKEEMETTYKQLVDEGYEGVILRNRKLFYADGDKKVEKTNKRSLKIRKLKPFKDSEFKVIGFREGVSEEHYSWVCITDEGYEFDVDATGSKALRIKNAREKEKIMGNFANIRFQDYTRNPKEGGVPRFGKFYGLRDMSDV